VLLHRNGIDLAGATSTPCSRATRSILSRKQLEACSPSATLGVKILPSTAAFEEGGQAAHLFDEPDVVAAGMHRRASPS
jgi:hypothetical protein